MLVNRTKLVMLSLRFVGLSLASTVLFRTLRNFSLFLETTDHWEAAVASGGSPGSGPPLPPPSVDVLHLSGWWVSSNHPNPLNFWTPYTKIPGAAPWEGNNRFGFGNDRGAGRMLEFFQLTISVKTACVTFPNADRYSELSHRPTQQ